MPKLQVFRDSVSPTISAISATPTTGGQQDTYTLSISATTEAAGGIASYQWYGRIGSSGEWNSISGATSATYQFVPGDQALGDIYFKAVVTGADGGVVDSYDAGYTDVKITIILAPQISNAAANPTTGPLRQTVQLSADVTSTTTATYQWQEQISGSWTDISGATSATYTVSIADTAATLHSYRLQATNIGGTTTSATITYQSVAPPAISAVSATPTTGPLTQTVQLSATVTGATAYQWQEQTGSTWTNIQGATAATYTVSIADTAATLHSYRLQATNVGGTTTSNPVTYQSVAPPVISAVSATPTTGPLTQTVQLSATVTGATAYQWQQQAGGSWTNIQGATAATYTVNIADTAATLHSYRLQATNIGGTTTSNTVSYQSVLPPAISAVSANPASGPLTQTVQLSVSATGAGSYQWQEQISGSWTAISGATSATVSVSIADNAPTLHTYRVIVTGIGGTATSDSVTYQSSTGPLITAISANPASGPLTQTVQLSVSAVSENPITYQWQEQLAGIWTNIQGATAATYTVSIADTVQTVHTYRVLATDVGGTTPSSTVSYSSIAPPQIQGANINPAIGKYTETITLSAEVTGADSYQWQQLVGNTWTNINGATTNPWVGTQTVTGDTQYRLQATNAGGTTSSAPIQYTIAGPANIQSLTATPSVVALPGSTVLQISGTNIIEVEWQQLVGSAWQTIGTGTSLSQTITTVGETSYRAVVLGTDGAQTTTNTIVVLSGYAPTVDIIEPVNGDEFGVGNTITAQGTITGTDVIYEWSFGQGGSGAQTNPTTITYTSQGYKTITLKAESIFGSAEDTVTILYGKAPRPMQTELFDNVDTSPVDNFMNQFDVTPGEMPNPVGIIGSLYQPFDDALKGFFWVLVFGAIMLVIWLITKNVAIPSVLGILFGAFMVGFMPDMYLYPAVALIAAGCAGGVLYVVRKN